MIRPLRKDWPQNPIKANSAHKPRAVGAQGIFIVSVLVLIICGCNRVPDEKQEFTYPQNTQPQSTPIEVWNEEFSFLDCSGDLNFATCRRKTIEKDIRMLEKRLDLLVETLGYEYEPEKSDLKRARFIKKKNFLLF